MAAAVKRSIENSQGTPLERNRRPVIKISLMAIQFSLVHNDSY